MGKPSLLSMGIGLGALLLTGSGITIPTLWHQASRTAAERDTLAQLQAEAQTGRDVSEKALAQANEQLSQLQAQLDANDAQLQKANESKRLLTNQLASLQEENRNLSAVEGTLKLRDQELDAMTAQFEKLRSQNELTGSAAADDAVATHADHTSEAGPAAQAEQTPDDGATAAGKPTVDSDAVAGLVPVPPREPASDKPVQPEGGDLASEKTDEARPSEQVGQSVAKPATSTPVRFDDSGWKSVAPTSGVSTSSTFYLPATTFPGYPTFEPGPTFYPGTTSY